MKAFAFRQGRKRLLGTVGEHGGILQVIDRQSYHSEPLLNGFEGLQTEIAETQDFFEIQVIDFYGPTLLVEFQGFLRRKAGVCTEEVLGAGIPGAFFREDDVDFPPHLFKVSGHGTDMVGGSAAVAYSLQRDFLVRLVLERLGVAVDALLLDFAIGFEGADDMPVLAQAEIDQFGRGVPGVEQHIHLAVCG
jgi:hypothetical protein